MLDALIILTTFLLGFFTGRYFYRTELPEWDHKLEKQLEEVLGKEETEKIRKYNSDGEPKEKVKTKVFSPSERLKSEELMKDYEEDFGAGELSTEAYEIQTRKTSRKYS